MASKSLLEFIEKMNQLGARSEPFLFIISYDQKSCIVLPLEDCKSHDIFFDIEGHSNFPDKLMPEKIVLTAQPLPFHEYLQAFNIVQNEIHKGNSYLVNLTFPTPVSSNTGLQQIFKSCAAKYKLLYKNEFLVFSPECFVKIENGKISTFPMKGTIDAQLENAEETLLANEKETAEHATIVDLLRNDLSMVSENVRLEKYRYIETVNTSGKNLLQMSSVISGDLPPGYNEKLGNIITKLLPAGSICGAPKKATLEIISRAETYNRGFYTGVFGVFDGKSLNSGVMIRFIENKDGRLIYKSGGGITAKSDPREEYQELIDKIYVPIN